TVDGADAAQRLEGLHRGLENRMGGRAATAASADGGGIAIRQEESQVVVGVAFAIRGRLAVEPVDSGIESRFVVGRAAGRKAVDGRFQVGQIVRRQAVPGELDTGRVEAGKANQADV